MRWRWLEFTPECLNMREGLSPKQEENKVNNATLKLANAYLESLKMMLNEKEGIKVQPMTNGPQKIKMKPEWMAQPVVVKQKNVKSIEMEILDYQERAEIVEYGNGEFYDETSDPERLFREFDQDYGFFFPRS
ncbi:unnamed protein product [Caenorhabditis nigoni]